MLASNQLPERLRARIVISESGCLENIRRGARNNRDLCRNGLHAWISENIGFNRARGGFEFCRPCKRISSARVLRAKCQAQRSLHVSPYQEALSVSLPDSDSRD